MSLNRTSPWAALLHNSRSVASRRRVCRSRPSRQPLLRVAGRPLSPESIDCSSTATAVIGVIPPLPDAMLRKARHAASYQGVLRHVYEQAGVPVVDGPKLFKAAESKSVT